MVGLRSGSMELMYSGIHSVRPSNWDSPASPCSVSRGSLPKNRSLKMTSPKLEGISGEMISQTLRHSLVMSYWNKSKTACPNGRFG